MLVDQFGIIVTAQHHVQRLTHVIDGIAGNGQFRLVALLHSALLRCHSQRGTVIVEHGERGRDIACLFAR